MCLALLGCKGLAWCTRTRTPKAPPRRTGTSAVPGPRRHADHAGRSGHLCRPATHPAIQNRLEVRSNPPQERSGESACKAASLRPTEQARTAIADDLGSSRSCIANGRSSRMRSIQNNPETSPKSPKARIVADSSLQERCWRSSATRTYSVSLSRKMAGVPSMSHSAPVDLTSPRPVSWKVDMMVSQSRSALAWAVKNDAPYTPVET